MNGHICKKCKVLKPTLDFYTRKLRNGSVVPRKECKACRALRDKVYIASLTTEQLARRNKLMGLRQRRFAVEHPFYWLAKQVRFRAKRTKPTRIAEISAEYLQELWQKQAGRCALTDKPMVLDVLDKRGWRNQKDRVSVDRINPDLGYTRENTQLVTAMANICKNAYQQPDFIDMCHAVSAHWAA